MHGFGWMGKNPALPHSARLCRGISPVCLQTQSRECKSPPLHACRCAGGEIPCTRISVCRHPQSSCAATCAATYGGTADRSSLKTFASSLGVLFLSQARTSSLALNSGLSQLPESYCLWFSIYEIIYPPASLPKKNHFKFKSPYVIMILLLPHIFKK